jgi:isopenicillin N synthase-like dioxygenase
MYLKNIGIEEVLITETISRSQQFFNLPLAEKNKLAWSDEFSNSGYVGIERERLDESQPGDLKEAFNISKNGQSALNQSFGEFFSACSDAATMICKVMAMALELPESFFVERHARQDYTLRLLHYPPITQPPKVGQTRAGEHSDYGSFTLLFQDSMGGLEILNAAGKWLAAPAIPDTIIVNTGDLMQRWTGRTGSCVRRRGQPLTNRVFCSTKHRVRIPIGKAAERSRYSIAFFCHPNFDTEISCLATCQDSAHPPLYSPITAGEYLLSRLQATY